ncbi:serine hydrolase domain-containing protein [Sphingomonas sp. HF-S3]|uniref:Serine hydrolase domain-containing protein n=1 Tax=Sphingomonas rustica TaxID=3103142 RepID=A0ABV0B576_9SPHN
MWKRSWKAVAAGVLALAVAVPALTQPGTPLAPKPATAESAAAVPITGTSYAANLTKTDADAWLDGYMPYALARGDVAGAVVVIVKDGQVVTERGYGYSDVAKRKPVDPATTLFRPGSTSKLFTWTAVMQQVEAGKLNLDADVNQYLDFKIPDYQGKPVTLRQIMTHTAGFEEIIKGLLAFDHVTPLGEELKKRVPERIFAPGTTPAYSNYATALAGYIVERVSGMPFDDYIERNIFQRLGMAHSTFRQPLPANLKPFMSQGYMLGSGKAEKYEMISLAPAGSLAASGSDMAKFMIAHLNDGGPLIKPETARLMHTPAGNILPGVNRMALGFYEQDINGHTAVAHGGDTVFFHSDLLIWPKEKVGVFISVNSPGKDGAAGAIRGALMDQFADRYLPVENPKPLVELPTAKEHAKMLVGTWTNSRKIGSNFASIVSFISDATVSLDADGRPLIPSVTTRGGAPRTWIETAPFVWQASDGHQRLAAKVVDGKIVRWSVDDISPFMVFDRTPWYLDGAWLMPLFLIGVGVILLTALAWPVAALTRRRFGATLALAGNDRKAYRLVRGFSWLVIGVLIGWAIVITGIENFEAHGSTDWLIYLVQILGAIGFFGLVGVAIWNALRVWTGKRGWFAKLWSVLLVLSAVFVLWVALAFKLISFGAAY